MVKKIIACVLIAFFVSLFLACSKRPPPKEEPLNLISLDNSWTQITKGEPFPWDSLDGFFPNKEHKYGFDRYPAYNGDDYVSVYNIVNNMTDSLFKASNIDSTYNFILANVNGVNTDSIVYISVLNGDSGKVNLKINQRNDNLSDSYDYYICKPDYPYEVIATIDNSKKEIPYTVPSNEKVIALCKKSDVGTQKLQELHISSYNWQIYDFYVYILGDSTKISDERHQLLNSTNFWNLFDSVYAQAVVKHDSSRLFGEFKAMDKGYVLTKANGNYSNCAYNSDIDNAVEYVKRNIRNGGPLRHIIQVGYPTKRVWPLKVDGNNKIQICGTTKENPVDNLELETSNCPEAKKTKASVSRKGDVWVLNDTLTATGDNVDTECMVFAEAKNDENDIYVGEVKIYGNKNTTSAVTFPYIDTGYLKIFLSFIVIQPWLYATTAKTVLHELGHSMKLLDIESIFPSYAGKRNNEENNLMLQGGDTKSLKLRKRGIFTLNGLGVGLGMSIEGANIGLRGLEYQWDCLHGISGACGFDPRD